MSRVADKRYIYDFVKIRLHPSRIADNVHDDGWQRLQRFRASFDNLAFIKTSNFVIERKYNMTMMEVDSSSSGSSDSSLGVPTRPLCDWNKALPYDVLEHERSLLHDIKSGLRLAVESGDYIVGCQRWVRRLNV
jgi:hypothetical protein